MNALSFTAIETAGLQAGAHAMFGLLATVAEAIEPEVVKPVV